MARVYVVLGAMGSSRVLPSALEALKATRVVRVAFTGAGTNPSSSKAVMVGVAMGEPSVPLARYRRYWEMGGPPVSKGGSQDKPCPFNITTNMSTIDKHQVQAKKGRLRRHADKWLMSAPG
jgi:hypothetical protein